MKKSTARRTRKTTVKLKSTAQAVLREAAERAVADSSAMQVLRNNVLELISVVSNMQESAHTDRAFNAAGVQNFATGAKRGNSLAGYRYDLLNEVAERRLAATQNEGAAKYGADNYRAGMPLSEMLNHVMAHINAYRAGNCDEDDLAHAAWGLCAMMYFEERHPQLQDIYNRCHPKLSS